jgi:hypothetical protein
VSSTTIECHACRYPVAPGAALLVTPLTGSPPPAPFVVHRVSIVAGCIRAAGRIGDASIAEFDPAAARAFDRLNADGGSRANGPTFEAQARARNLAISAGRPRFELREED